MYLKFYHTAATQLKLLFTITAITCASTGFSQPDNDNCTGAILVTPSAIGAPCSPENGSTVASTTSTTPSFCYGGPVRDVWYRFVATATTHTATLSNITLTTPTGIAFYAYGMAAYSGNCGALTLLSCSNADAERSPGVTISGLTPGQTYYLQIWFGYCYNTSYQPIVNNVNFGLCVTESPAPPVNDACNDAQPIFGVTPVSGSTANASDDGPASISCGTNYDAYNKGVWYKLTPAQSGTLTISACGTTFDSYLRVYNGANCGSFTSCAGNNDDAPGCGVASSVTFNAVANTVYHILLTSIANSENGNFTLSVTGVPLEVNMSELKGNITAGNQVQLHWSTYNERNNKGFEIQRSTDGRHFEYTGFIPSHGVNGNSLMEQAYSFTDPAPLAGRMFYRLKQTDYDNTSSYSNIINLATGTTAFSLIANPNPVQNRLNIQIANNAPSARIQITDLSGKVCRNVEISDANTAIDMSALASGIYLLRYTDALQTQTLKVQKQ